MPSSARTCGRAQPANRRADTPGMTNKLLALMIAAAAGCGVVTKPGPATGGSDDPGEDAGTDLGSDSGSGSGHPDFSPNKLVGSVVDERADAIDFSSGEPVHTHVGSTVDLSSGCPAVYKYFYLTDAQARYGTQTAANPLAWKVWNDSPSPSINSAFRVRTAAGTVLQDWTAMTVDSEAVYHIAIHRDATAAMAALGSYVGQIFVDARFRDSGGNETINSACWENHPLAAPLKVDPVAEGALFGMTLAANSHISPLINLGSVVDNAFGGEIASMPITQFTAEPTTITLGAQPTGVGTSRSVAVYLPGTNQTVTLGCPSATTGNCAGSPAPPVYANKTGALVGLWQLRIVDDANNILCRTVATSLTCTIPGRGSNQPPTAYRAVLSLANERTLQPPIVGSITETTFSETNVGAYQFTGSHVGVYSLACLRTAVGSIGAAPWTCISQGNVYLSQVLAAAKIDFDAIPISVTTGSGLAALSPAYVDAATLTLAARTWNGGNANVSQEF